ncbi:hypothetical protein RJ639_008869 [Escallonia herrerae]|uniref:Xylanase inhibitor N-terminal domain-containing protein n=1 Tax=Escallonia herrerae TaxID=1293975 RepID=A0AA89AS05_9ASTE|nr:hypothetical protein RJ639_008869 [Escallonia herrerae]
MQSAPVANHAPVAGYAGAQTSFRPKALVLPVSKDPSTLQYITHLNQRTPLVSVNLTLHLGGESLWVNSESKDYVTSTFRPARCRSAQCNLAGSTACVTATNTYRFGRVWGGRRWEKRWERERDLIEVSPRN